MKYSIKILTIAFFALVLWNCEGDEKQTVTTMENLVWSDDFDGNELDASKWNCNLGTGQNGWGNNELQYYTNRNENIRQENGMLIITAIQESHKESGYTSARINTKDLFSIKYGRIEARMKLPWGKGLWAAFWLLGDNIDEVGWPNCGEIDIMENRGQEPTIINGSVHGLGYSGSEAETKSYELSHDRFDIDFHVFGIEWGENYINYYVDDVLYNQITPTDLPKNWLFDHSFFIIINLAVGGSYVGSPNAETIFPQKLLVDWIKVYN